jgi:hypothetical protein
LQWRTPAILEFRHLLDDPDSAGVIGSVMQIHLISEALRKAALSIQGRQPINPKE